MRGIGLVVAMLVAANGALRAQQEERQVMAVVQQLFDGMRAKDTVRMRAVLHPQARLVSAGTRDGVAVVDVESPDRWLASVARAPSEGGQLDERLRNPLVRVDGGLATVWAEYTFYIGDRMSHCGVDAFHLVRTPEGWRIIDLADTRRREGCAP